MIMKSKAEAIITEVFSIIYKILSVDEVHIYVHNAAFARNQLQEISCPCFSQSVITLNVIFISDNSEMNSNI